VLVEVRTQVVVGERTQVLVEQLLQVVLEVSKELGLVLELVRERGLKLPIVDRGNSFELLHPIRWPAGISYCCCY
jgi:hypothetical protein